MISVGYRTARVGFVVAVGVTLIALASGPARALSCAQHPNASPLAIAEGTEELAVDGTFRDHYDGVILGTIRSMETQNNGAAPDYGRTELVVEVTGTYGPAVGSQAVVVEDDPGWLNGYAFEVGTHYFIPYVENEKGRYSHLCDPIAEVDPAEVPDLIRTAEQNAWSANPNAVGSHPSEQSLVADGQPPTDEAGTDTSSLSSAADLPFPAWLIVLTVAGVVGAAGWALRRQRAGRTTRRLS